MKASRSSSKLKSAEGAVSICILSDSGSRFSNRVNASSAAFRPTSRCMYWNTMLYSACVPVERVRPNVTSEPAMHCSSMATCSMMCPIQVPSSSRILRMKPPALRYEQPCSSSPGRVSTSLSTNCCPIFAEGHSSSTPKSSTCRITGKCAYRLGP